MRRNVNRTSVCLIAILSGLIAGALPHGALQGQKAPDTSAQSAPTTGVSPTNSLPASKAKEVLDATSTEEAGSYKLVYQDKIKFSIEEDPIRDSDFPELIVSSLGLLNFPVSRAKGSPILPIKALGKTLDQVKAEVVALLEAEYYHKATLSIQLTSKSERYGQVLFTGSIIKGLMKLNPGERKRLSEAIVEKGYTEYARLSKVKVLRIDPSAKKPKIIYVDVDSVLHKGRKDLDLILEDGDTVDVPEKGLVF